MADSSSSKHGRSAHRRALVTGASAGIGTAFAESLARDRYDLILVARRRERLETIAQQLHKERGVHVEVLPADLTDRAELRVVEKVLDDAKLDLLVNNAGFGTFGTFAQLEVDKEEEEVQLNVIALMRLTRAALPGMVARGRGGIINVSSMAALQPGPYNATYGATKAFVNSFTEAIHEELRGTGVRIQALCPGFTRTEFQEHAGVDTSDLPSFAWMTAAAVAEASLAALQRGDVVCVPGVANRAIATLASAAPRFLSRRVVATFSRRLAE